MQKEYKSMRICRQSADGRGEHAFSLVEVVLALGIVSFVIVGIMGLLLLGMSTFRRSIDTTVQAQIAQRIISDAQLTDFKKLASFSAYFDESGTEVQPSDSRWIYSAQVTWTHLPQSLTGDFSPQVAGDFVVLIQNKMSPKETQTYWSVLVKND